MAKMRAEEWTLEEYCETVKEKKFAALKQRGISQTVKDIC